MGLKGRQITDFQLKIRDPWRYKVWPMVRTSNSNSQQEVSGLWSEIYTVQSLLLRDRNNRQLESRIISFFMELSPFSVKDSLLRFWCNFLFLYLQKTRILTKNFTATFFSGYKTALNRITFSESQKPKWVQKRIKNRKVLKFKLWLLYCPLHYSINQIDN